MYLIGERVYDILKMNSHFKFNIKVTLNLKESFDIMDPIDFTEKKFFSDLEITSSDDIKLYFNKFTLTTSSKYFDRMFMGDFKEGNSNKISLMKSSNCLKVILNYLFHCKINIDKEILYEVVQAIDEYLLIYIADEVYQWIIDHSKEYDSVLLLNIATTFKNKLLIDFIEKCDRDGNPWFPLDFKDLNPGILSFNLSVPSTINIVKKFFVLGVSTDDLIKIIPVERFANNNIILFYLLESAQHSVETSQRYKTMVFHMYKEEHRKAKSHDYSHKSPENPFK